MGLIHIVTYSKYKSAESITTVICKEKYAEIVLQLEKGLQTSEIISEYCIYKIFFKYFFFFFFFLPNKTTSEVKKGHPPSLI